MNVARELLAGTVTAVVTIAHCIGYAALIFSGSELEPFLASGLRTALVAGALVAFVLARMSTLPFTTGGPQGNATALLAIMAGNVTSALVESGVTGEPLAAAVMTLLTLTAVLIGVILLVLGLLRQGQLVRLVPYPVSGGFLAGSALLLAAGAWKIITGHPLGWDAVTTAAHTPALAWVTALGVAVALIAGSRAPNRVQYLLLPGVIVAGVVLFYAGIWMSGQTLDWAREHGMVLRPIGRASWTLGWWSSAAIPWGVLGAEWRNFLAMAVIVVVTILLNATVLELSTQEQTDLDRELSANGVANVVAGLGGGMLGYLSPALSVLSQRAGSVSRLSGTWSAVLCAAAAAIFAPALPYLPRPVLAGLLIFVGVRIVREWLWDARRTLPRRDWLLVMGIVVVIVTSGIIVGVLSGLIVASVYFAYTYSRANYIRYNLSCAIQRSNKDRSLDEMAMLRERGEAGRILCLQGYLFFALANRLVDVCREAITRHRLSFLLLEFRMVQNMDTSAALAIAKLHQHCARAGVTLVLCELRPSFERLLSRVRVLPSPDIRVFPDLDHGLEWVEDQFLADGTPADGHEREGRLRTVLGRNLSPQAVDILLARCEPVELPEGAVLMKHGAVGDALYFVDAGELSVLVPLEAGQRRRVRGLRAGTVVGEMAIYSGQPRSADVVAETPCRLLRLSAQEFGRVQHDHPDVALQFHTFMATVMAHRLAAANDELRALM